MKKPLKILMGENLVWNCGVKVGSHHYGEFFLKNQNRIFWLALPWNIFHLLVKGKKEERIKHWKWNRPIRIKEDFYCLSPFTLLPYRNNFLVRGMIFADLALKFTIPNIYKILKIYGFNEVDILWITDPRMFYLTTKISYKALIYRCVDDFALFKDVSPSVSKLENILVKKSDIVFATSFLLLEKLSKIRKDVIYLPNGVDNDFFANSYHPNLLPKEFQEKNKPIAVYVGTVGDWFDVELLSRAARELPEVKFIIVGPIRRNIDKLNGIPNVISYGPMPYESIPTILKVADVGIIPFKINRLTDAVSPIKLFEYFSCGLPVVAPKVKEIMHLNSPAELYEGVDEFIVGLKRALSYGKEKPGFEDFARKNSWKSRFEIIKKAYNFLSDGQL